MSVTERTNILNKAIAEYGFNKVLSVVVISMVSALVGCIISVNVIPNDNEIVKESK